MQDVERLKNVVSNICKSALNGELILKKFYEIWPVKANENEFLKQLYTDIEDAIEHLPGSLISGKILYSEWYKSDIYRTIFLDSILLNYNQSASDLLTCRKYVIEHKGLSEEKIKEIIREYFGTA